MTYRGHVENGLVVLDDPVSLPEGAQVQVAVVDVSNREPDSDGGPTLYERLGPVIGMARDEEHDLSVWRSEVSYFEKVRPQLWKDTRYRNKYVAIRCRRVIDADDNKFVLARRMAERFPDDVVLIAKVQLRAPVVQLRSPRLQS